MRLGTCLRLLALAALLAPQAALCAGERTPWGARVSGNYDVWGWLAEYTGEDEESWAELEPDRQDAELARGKAACERAGARLASTRNQTDGLAILALSESDLGQIGVCVNNGQALASSLEAKKTRLAAIRANALQGRYNEADMDWMRQHGITMPQEGQAVQQREAEQAASAKKQQLQYDAARKKYGKLKGQDAAGLAGIYDGGKSAGSGPERAPAANLSGKRLAMPKPGARNPTTKSLTAAAPPSLAGPAAANPAAPRPASAANPAAAAAPAPVTPRQAAPAAPRPAAAPAARQPSYREGSAADPTTYFEDPGVKTAVAKVWAKAEERLADPNYRSETYTSNPVARAVYNNLASKRVKTAMAANELMMGYRYNGEDDVKAFERDFGVRLTQSQIADIDHFYSGASYSAIPVAGAIGGVLFSAAYDGAFDIARSKWNSGNGRVKYNVRQVGVDVTGCAFGMALTGTDIGEGTARALE